MNALINFTFYTIALIGAALSLILMGHGETLHGAILLGAMAIVTAFHAATN